MKEFVEALLSSFEVFGVTIPLLWVLAGIVLVVAVLLRTWSTVGVAALLAGLSYLAPFVRP